MDDELIVKLYWDRSENAISETDRKYGAYCHSIAYGILQSKEDAEESVNDTYMDAWNSMPPHRPSILATFLGKITRRISIDRWRNLNRANGAAEKSLLHWKNWSNALPTATMLRKRLRRKSWCRQSIDSWIHFLYRNGGYSWLGTGIWTLSKILRLISSSPRAR